MPVFTTLLRFNYYLFAILALEYFLQERLIYFQYLNKFLKSHWQAIDHIYLLLQGVYQ